MAEKQDSGNSSNSIHTNHVKLDLTDEIKKERIVSSFVFDKRIDSLRLSLNHKSRQKIIISPVEDNWPKTIETFKKQLKLKGVNERHTNQLCDVVDNNADSILDLNDDNNDHDDVDNNHHNSKTDEKPAEQAVELLRSRIPNNDFVEYAFDKARKTIKQENALVRQIGYTGLSTYTNDPLNLGIMAPSSEGKTYAVIEVMKLFPKQDVWNIGSMTPKVLIRLKGMIVNRYNESIDVDVKRLTKEISLLGNGKGDRRKKVELKEQLTNLLEGSKTLIELSGTILLFLEPPDAELWKMIKPILSHDLKEIEFPYVDTTSGIQVKKVVVRGWPACIFCSAKDESKWPEWDQIRTRFQITSPNMIQKKYHESNILIAQRKGLPSLLQQDLIVSNEDIELAKLCILYTKNQIQELCKCGNNAVWIPYGTILGERLPDQKGSDTRTTGRIFTFIDIITMAKAHLRHKLVFGPETQMIATLQDLNEALHITHNMSGIATYKVKFFRNTFIPCLRSKTRPDSNKDGSKEEDIIAVTTRDFCDYYKKINGKTINTDNLRKTYLAELIDYGFIDEQDSIIHQNHKIYTAIIDLPSNTTELEEESLDWSSWSNLKQFDQNLHDIAINVPENCNNIAENWLELAFSDLKSGRIHSDQIGLLSVDDSQITLEDFMSDYQKNDSLIRYFTNPRSCNSNNKTDTSIQDVGDSEMKNAESWSKRLEFDQKVQTFLQRFSELEQESLDGTVKRDELMDNLLSSGKFYQSDAAMLIEEALRLGVLQQASPDVFRRAVESDK